MTAALGCTAGDDGAADAGSSGDGPTSAAASSADDPSDGGTTMGNADGTTVSGASASATTGDDDPTAATESTATSADTTTAGDDSSSGSGSFGDTGGDEQSQCRGSGGTWDDSACGHYVCGIPNACEALIPGCNCGATMNFVDGEGCVADEDCLAAMFPCGDALQCIVATQYCEIFYPGVKGADISYSCGALPEACLVDHSCACVDDAGLGAPAGTCSEGDDGALTVQLFGA